MLELAASDVLQRASVDSEAKWKYVKSNIGLVPVGSKRCHVIMTGASRFMETYPIDEISSK